MTALRWAKRLRELAWDVKVDEAWDGRPADILIALHARKSRDSIERWSSGEKTRPLVVAATGTDVYVDLQGDSPEARSALEGLERADRIVVLQKHGLQDLPAHLHERARVVHQSLHAGGVRPDADQEKFEGVVLGNLAELYQLEEQLGRARPLYVEALALHREVENRRMEGYTLARLAWLDALDGEFDLSRTRLDDGILSRLAETGALESLEGKRRDALWQVQGLERREDSRLDLVTREEFEVQEAVLATQLELWARVRAAFGAG